MKNYFKINGICAAIVMSAFGAHADVTFTEIPAHIQGALNVANNGTVVFNMQNPVWGQDIAKWSLNEGVVKLGTATPIPTTPSVSDDGKLILIRNAANSSVLISDSVSVNVDLSGMRGFSISGDGSFIGGTSIESEQAAKLNVSTGEYTLLDSPLPNWSSAKVVMNAAGNNFVVSNLFDFNGATEYFISDDNELAQEVESVSGLRHINDISDNGEILAGAIFNTCPLEGYSHCPALWNKKTGEVTGIPPINESYNSSRINADASIVVGYGGLIWDAVNGTRNIVDILESKGIDVSDWSEFGFSDISQDGTKIAGMATNPQGEKSAYLIDIIPQCSTGF